MRLFSLGICIAKTPIYLLAMIILLNLPHPAHSAVEESDSLSLVAIYIAYHGNNWNHKQNWLTTPVGQWEGITLDNTNTRVIGMNYDNNGIVGMIPEFTIADILAFGQTLSLLDIIKLTPIVIKLFDYPAARAPLGQLRVLSAAVNKLSGEIPDSIGRITNLEILNLNGNLFNGPVKPTIAKLSKLKQLNLGNNKFSGTIPSGLYNLTNLELLNLGSNQLIGNIPSGISNLKNLTDLYLNDNQFLGNIPIEIGDLISLRQLALSENFFTGAIPAEIGKLTNLKGLNLANNKLSDSIPPEIGNLTLLEYLALNNNRLSGNIPPEIGDLQNLTSGLMLCNNQLSGIVPYQMTFLNKLKYCRIDGNQLSGALPADFFYMQALESFNFENNLIDEIDTLSNIDSLLFCKTNNLTFEDFERNLDALHKPRLEYEYSPQLPFGRVHDTLATEGYPFSLSIPCGGIYNHYQWYKNNILLPDASDSSVLFFPIISRTDSGTYFITVTNDSVPYLTLTSLPVHLNVKEHCIKIDSLALVALYNATNGNNWTRIDNWLKGPVSSWSGIVANSCNVQEIKLENNNMAGTIPPEIGNLSKLQNLSMYRNNLTGNIPHEIGKLSNLTRMYLDDNQLTGLLPVELWNLKNLQVLWLTLNNFSEQHIPAQIKNLTDLRSLSLGQMQLTGTIPPEIWGLDKLTDLALYGNKLSGEISSSVGNLKNLIQLHLNENLLTGRIPPEIGNLSELNYLGLNHNQISGSIPPEIGDLRNLNKLRLNSNQLSGDIPVQIGKLSSLQELSLNDNQLIGEVTAEIGDISSLTELNLNNNQLSGAVPLHLTSLHLLKVLRLQNNLLVDIPTFLTIDSLFECFTNNLTFEDFERNLELINNKKVKFNYSPQLPFGMAYNITAVEGQSLTLTIPTAGDYNHYMWFKDGSLLNPSPDNYNLSLSKLSLSDAGDYYITVTNEVVPILELTSWPITVIIEKKPSEPMVPVNLVIIEGSRNPNFMIEHLEDYPGSNLVMYTKWGKKVYEKMGYNNDLDFSNYLQGTYYYILTYQTDEGEKKIKSFVDVIKK